MAKSLLKRCIHLLLIRDMWIMSWNKDEILFCTYQNRKMYGRRIMPISEDDIRPWELSETVNWWAILGSNLKGLMSHYRAVPHNSQINTHTEPCGSTCSFPTLLFVVVVSLRQSRSTSLGEDEEVFYATDRINKLEINTQYG